MISAQLGTAQLGLAQLGAYSALETPSGAPPGPSNLVYYNTAALNYIVLPDYFKLLGYCLH
jgi:hypothetical protein